MKGRYGKWITANGQKVIEDIWKAYDEGDVKGALELRRQKLGEYYENNPEMYKLWKETDKDIIRMDKTAPQNWKRYKNVVKAVMDPKLELDLGTRVKMYKYGVFESVINSNKFLT
ncbi:MAG: hypothetical protein V1870_03650 [Candidatus Aenigmatarchaeota archaeon]